MIIKTTNINTANNSEESACADAEPFALMVLGDDMQPEFTDGTIITIDPSHPLLSGTFVVVDIDNNVCFGQFSLKNNRKFLTFLNDKPDLPLTDENIIKGVVIQSYKKRITTHYQYTGAHKFTRFVRDRRQKLNRQASQNKTPKTL